MAENANKSEVAKLAEKWTIALTAYYHHERSLINKYGSIPHHCKGEMDKLRVEKDRLRREMRLAQGISPEFA